MWSAVRRRLARTNGGGRIVRRGWADRIPPVHGTHDLLPDEHRAHRHVIDSIRTVVERYGFVEVATPIFEFTHLYTRSLGSASDVVSKEMYTFTDINGESLTLRPENTSGAVRALLHASGLQQQLPQRWFYAGPMFRRERPQKGRLRQFHQAGAEWFGACGDPDADAETIRMAADALEALGVLHRTKLLINTLGDAASREAYAEQLGAFLRAHADQLSVASRQRVERGSLLRVLDSKDPADRAVLQGAPSILDALTPAARAHYAALQRGLRAVRVAYDEAPGLVRGLDYYSHTVFEFEASLGLGAQATVLAGGRYDGLVPLLGGPAAVGAVGWAAGVERLRLLLEAEPAAVQPPPVPPRVAVLRVAGAGSPSASADHAGEEGGAVQAAVLQTAQRLRAAGLVCVCMAPGKVGKQIQSAVRQGAVAAVLVGEDELRSNRFTVKHLPSGEQKVVGAEDLVAFVRQWLARGPS